jgi:molybdopterin-guanine dinucleotide biosynthesis protein A
VRNAGYLKSEITGAVLAGGAGRRMDGADKGLLLLGGRPLVQRVIERLAPQVGPLLVSANRNRERYLDFGWPVVGDVLSGFCGPLAGLQAVLAAARTPLVLCVPCDSPFLPADLAARLFAGLCETDADLAVARADDRVERAFCLLRRELLPVLDGFLVGGGRRVGDWHRTVRCVEVDFATASAFANINSPDDLARLDAAAAAP